MRFLRYGELGKEKPGLLDLDGKIRDLSSYIGDLTPAILGDATCLQRLKNLIPNQLPLVSADARLGSSVGNPGKIIFVGFNTTVHAQALGFKPLKNRELLVFMKPTCAACGPNDPILYTRQTKKLDWEAELGIVIGKKGKYIPLATAKEYIFGYTCINDLSERYLQFETEDKQFTKGKCFDNAAPIGPYIVTKDEIADTSNLTIELWVNDKPRQSFNSGDYLYNDEEVVSYLSQYFTLYPGDIISMGSGPGNATSWGENAFLKPNDVVTLSISHLGQQKQTVILE